MAKHPYNPVKNTKERALKMGKMLGEGYSLSQIANEFNISPQRVHQILSRIWKKLQ